MLKGFLFKLNLFHKGIRFYRTDAMPRTPQFKTAIFQTVNGRQVEFHFYKEACEDLIYRHGRIRSEKFIGYVIQAKLDQALPARLVNYNNLKFFFNSRNWIIKNDELICQTLLNIYLDFLKAELKQSN
jgi:hypothetical protein